MSDAPTPLTGTEVPRPSDKFQLSIIVTRLEAQIAVLREQIECLNESDERQDDKIVALEKNLTDITQRVVDLVKDIKVWRQEAAEADAGHAQRLAAIERRISGFGSVLVLLQLAFEAWKLAHTGH